MARLPGSTAMFPCMPHRSFMRWAFMPSAAHPESASRRSPRGLADAACRCSQMMCWCSTLAIPTRLCACRGTGKASYGAMRCALTGAEPGQKVRDGHRQVLCSAARGYGRRPAACRIEHSRIQGARSASVQGAHRSRAFRAC